MNTYLNTVFNHRNKKYLIYLFKKCLPLILVLSIIFLLFVSKVSVGSNESLLIWKEEGQTHGNYSLNETFRRQEFEKVTSQNVSEGENSDGKNVVFSYVVNVTQITTKQNLNRLNQTLRNYSHHFDLDFKEMKEPRPWLIPKQLRLKYPSETGSFPSMPILTFDPNGRTGNVMGSYASLLALAKVYNVSVFLKTKSEKLLINLFPNISIRSLPKDVERQLKCIPVKYDTSMNNYSPIEIAAAGLFGPRCFVLTKYPFQMRLFNAIKEDLIREFTFSKRTQQKVHEYFASLRIQLKKEEKSREATFIGTHLRRTDYFHHLEIFGGKVPGEKFLKRAIEYYRKKILFPIFVASSDDPKFMAEALKSETDVVFTPGKSPEIDMAIMTSCNHSIFSVGSFGFWSSYLADGETVYADIITNKKEYRFTSPFYIDANLTNFTPIDGV